MSLKTIVLMRSDGETFEIAEAVALKFKIVANMIENDCAGEAIPIKNVTGDILRKAIEYSKKHVEAADLIGEEDEVERKNLEIWDEEFIEGMDLETILKLMKAANNLSFKPLLDLLCQTVADYIKDKEPEEVRAILNIQNDFTPEEEETIRKENQWGF